MPKPTKPPVQSQFAGLRRMSDKTLATLAASPDAPGETPQPPPNEVAEASAETVTQPKKRGRPPGKKSSPEYEQTTIILNLALKFGAKLYAAEKNTDLSSIIEVALEEYLGRRLNEKNAPNLTSTLLRTMKTMPAHKAFGPKDSK